MSHRRLWLLPLLFLTALSLRAQSDLLSAAERGKLEKVQKFLAAGADFNQRDFDGCTPLILSVRNQYQEITACLLEKGADPNLRSTNGNSQIGKGDSALHVACWLGDTQAVRRLLEAGASVGLLNDNGQTPLFLACDRNQREVVAQLLATGAKLDIVDRTGKRAVEYAAFQGHFHLMGWLWNKSRKGPGEVIPKPVYASNNDFSPLAKPYGKIRIGAYFNATGSHAEILDGISGYYTAHPGAMASECQTSTLASLNRSNLFQAATIQDEMAGPDPESLLITAEIRSLKLFNRVDKSGKFLRDKVSDSQDVTIVLKLTDAGTGNLLRTQVLSYTKPLAAQNPQALQERMQEIMTSIGEYIAAYVMITATP